MTTWGSPSESPIAEGHRTEGLPINVTSWGIVAALTILSTIAAGLLFATGLKANAHSAPTYDGRTGCDRALAGQSHCDIQGS